MLHGLRSKLCLSACAALAVLPHYSEAFQPHVGAWNQIAGLRCSKPSGFRQLSNIRVPLLPTKKTVQRSLMMSSVPSAAPAPVSSFLPPPAVYNAIASAGQAKASLPWWKTLYLGILAGVYIGFGCTLALSVGGAVPGLVAGGALGVQKMMLGAFGLPFGLLMVVVAGGELFTGNTAYLTAALAEGKATPSQVAKNWFWSYLGNLLGSIALVYMVAAAGVFSSPTLPSHVTSLAIAAAKTSLSFKAAFVRGVLCNWLVCLALWQAAAAQSIGGKAIAIWLPISAFVAMSFEHSVANMFFLPMGIVLGAPGVTWKAFLLNNLLPVTLGNAFAGAILVAGSYSLVYGAPGRALAAAAATAAADSAAAVAAATRAPAKMAGAAAE